MPDAKTSFSHLPEDHESLKAMLCSLLRERDREKARAEEQAKRAQEQTQKAQEQAKRAEDLHVENLRLQVELARYKKWYYGPRAHRLPANGDLAQALLGFAEELEPKPNCPDDVPAQAEPEYELARRKPRKGPRALARCGNRPVTRKRYDVS